MKIALVIERIEEWRGGAETSTLQFAQRAVEQGCDLTLISASRGQLPPGLALLTVKAPGLWRSRRTARFVQAATVAIRRGGFDLVHAVTPCPGADVYEPRGGAVPETLRRNLALRHSRPARTAKRIASRCNAKVRLLLRLERELVQRQPGPIVVALSHYVARQFHDHYGLTAPRVRVIFNGVEPDPASRKQREADDNDIRQQYDLQRNERLALCVAHNFRLKGVHHVIEAVAGLPADRRHHVRVIVVGRDNPVPLMRQSRRLGVADRIVFAGSTERISAFYHAADMLVHPTYYDPCSRVVLEALGAGVPVITTRFNGAAEVMTDGREGFILEQPDDAAALTDRIGRLLDEPFRRDCGLAAQRLADLCAMRRHAAEVVQLYREILEARTCRPPK